MGKYFKKRSKVIILCLLFTLSLIIAFFWVYSIFDSNINMSRNEAIIQSLTVSFLGVLGLSLSIYLVYILYIVGCIMIMFRGVRALVTHNQRTS